MPDSGHEKVTLSDGRTAVIEPIDYETMKEDWNLYKLQNGTTVKVKTIVARIALAFDENGEQLYTEADEPVVVVRSQTLISAQEAR